MQKICSFVLLIALLVSVAACRRQSAVPQETLVGVLTDIYLAEALLVKKNIAKDSEEAMLYYSQILAKHGISAEEYAETLRWYADRKPKELIALYDSVYSRLGKLKVEIERDSIRSLSVTPDTLAVPDSLAAAR